MDKNKKKELMLTVIGLVGLIAITVGVSVAFFNYTKTGASDNTLTTGSVMFTYTEVSGIGRGITLTDAIPMTDDLGIAQTGEGKVFEFKVSGKGANNAAIPYEVTARMSSDSDLDQSKVRIYLEKDNNQVLLDDYSELAPTTRVNSNTYTERTLYKGKIPRNSGENYTENFKLKMWLSSAAVSQNNEYPYSNKTFKITVNVYAEGNVYTQEDIDLEESANITSLAIGNGPALTASTNPAYDYDTTTTDRNITINVTPENENAQVTIEKVNNFAYNEESNIKRLSNSNVTSQNITLTGGDNYIKITVTPEDTRITPTIYKLHVYKTPSTDATLSSLSISNCPINETFDSSTTSYTCATTKSNLTVTATPTDLGATTSITGNTGLTRGTNTVTVVVTPEDTTAQTKTYTITVTKGEPFATDSWTTIINNVKNGTTSDYNVGDTKTVSMSGGYGTRTVRLANKSECTNETSETACGFVIEFVDVLLDAKMNETRTNSGGYPASNLYNTYLKDNSSNWIYNYLPSELQEGIIPTTVISGHETGKSNNYTTTDKIYLLSRKEVFGDSTQDSAGDTTKQLDYYITNGKSKNTLSYSHWWTRTACSNSDVDFYTVYTYDYDRFANNQSGLAPAFRIGSVE